MSRSKTADSVNQKKHSNVKINCSYTIPLPPHLLLQVLPPLHPLSLLCLRHCQMRCLGYCKYLHTANKIIKHQKIFNYKLFRLYFIPIFLTYMYRGITKTNYPQLKYCPNYHKFLKCKAKLRLKYLCSKKSKNYRRT